MLFAMTPTLTYRQRFEGRDCRKSLRDYYKAKTDEPIAAVTPEEEENYDLLVHCRCEGATDIQEKKRRTLLQFIVFISVHYYHELV